MLQLDNCHDEDWLIFADEKGNRMKEIGYRSIPLYHTVINHFIMGKNIKRDFHKASMIYQISVGFHDDVNYLFKEFNILEHKEVWIKWLKAYMNAEDTEMWAMINDVLPKQFYHILYQYNMIIEDTHFISEEAKTDIQKIHDYEMPSSYFYELKDMINSL